MFFFFKQKTAYELRISDWSSDVCSSDLDRRPRPHGPCGLRRGVRPPAGGPARQCRSPRGRCASEGRLMLTELALYSDRFFMAAVGAIGRASCRERVGQYVSISEVAVSLKKKQN